MALIVQLGREHSQQCNTSLKWPLSKQVYIDTEAGG